MHPMGKMYCDFHSAQLYVMSNSNDKYSLLWGKFGKKQNQMFRPRFPYTHQPESSQEKPNLPLENCIDKG